MINFWMKTAPSLIFEMLGSTMHPHSTSPDDKFFGTVRLGNEILLVYYTPKKKFLCINIGDVRVDKRLLTKGFKI